MNIPNEILYKIAESSDDYIKTLKGFRIEPRIEDWKYVFKNVLNEIRKEPGVVCLICAENIFLYDKRTYCFECKDEFHYDVVDVSWWFEIYPNDQDYYDEDRYYTFIYDFSSSSVLAIEVIDRRLKTRYKKYVKYMEFVGGYKSYMKNEEETTILYECHSCDDCPFRFYNFNYYDDFNSAKKDYDNTKHEWQNHIFKKRIQLLIHYKECEDEIAEIIANEEYKK